MYERHSGTGRGREVAKDGAGGKYVWGNEKTYNKKDVEQFNQQRGQKTNYYNDEDYCNLNFLTQ
jgi:hypothetical protein